VAISLFIAGLRRLLALQQRPGSSSVAHLTTLDLGARSRRHDAASLSDRALGFSAQGLMQF
jgi:hypothetical protein